MASSSSIAIPNFPSSYQLRFADRYRISSPILLRFRVRSDHRVSRLVCAIGAEARDGSSGRGESKSSDGSSEGSPDSFAGWSGAGSGDGEAGSKRGGFGGMLGAGLAGVLLVGGVAFASLSLRTRSNSGVKQQMEPLTREQEVILSGDGQSTNVDQVEHKLNQFVSDNERGASDCNPNSETGTSKDPLPSIDLIEDATERELDNHHLESSPTQNMGLASDGVDTADSDPRQDDLQAVLDNSNIPVHAGSDPLSPEYSAHDGEVVASNASSFKDSHSVMPSDELNDDQKGNFDTAETKLDTPETAGLKDSLELSREIEDQLSSVSVSSSYLVVDTGNLASQDTAEKESDFQYSDMLQLPNEVDTSYSVLEAVIPSKSDFDEHEDVLLMTKSISPDELKLNERALAYSGPESVLADLSGNKPDVKSHIHTDRSSLLESLLPEKSSSAGIPAPSLVSAALQVPPGKFLVPAVVDQVQGQALAALQVLKVIEPDVQPGDLCTRREYARWLVSASSALSRNTVSKVYPAMFIENVTELAFDDITPEDPDFAFIQGLAEAGLISSKLSLSDMKAGEHDGPILFSPECPLSRQDLVSWKMALENRRLPEVDRNDLFRCSGYIDIDKINPAAWPALVADLSAGENGITTLAFGYTRLFQPGKPVTKAQAAIALATGDAAEVVGEELTRIEAESLAETAVNAHTALVAQVEKDLNASFEQELAKEREKIDAIEKLAEEARLELERIKTEREEENNALIRGRAAVASEVEVLSRLRLEVEEQLHSLMSNKVEISFERDRISKLREEAEKENQAIVQLQYELEVERKALSMARYWAEEEAKRAREQARALEEARQRWANQGIKVVVDQDLQDDASVGVTWLGAGEQPQVEQTINRAEKLMEKLKSMAAEMKIKSSAVIEKIIQKIVSLISALKQWASEAPNHFHELRSTVTAKTSESLEGIQEKASEFSSNVGDRARRAVGEKASEFSSNVGDRARRVVDDCKESVEKLTQKFKT